MNNSKIITFLSGFPIPRFIYKIYNLYKNFKMPQQYKCFGDNNPDKTFYVIRLYPSVSGILTNYNSVLNYLIFAEQNNWIPIVDMENYKVSNSQNHLINNTNNAWEYYFNQPSNYSLQDVYKSKNVILSKGFISFDNITSSDTMLLYQRLAKKIMFNSQTLEIIKKKIKEKSEFNSNKKFLGVAVRGTEYLKAKHHSKQMPVEQLIDLAIKRKIVWGLDGIFVTTEEEKTIELFKIKIPDITFLNRNRFTNEYDGSTAVIYLSPKGISRYETDLDYLTEIYILSQCDSLIGSMNSGFRTAQIWNDGKYSHCELLDLGLN